ncbi:MAG: type 1 glutamine amidotransferase [Halobacteria archaeon]
MVFALLDASGSDDKAEENFPRDLGMDLDRFSVRDGEFPENHGYDATVITGSQAAAYSEAPWIHSMKEWIDAGIEKRMPFLGICFGYQVLADVLGGKVEARGKYEVGYQEIDRAENTLLLDGIPNPFTAFDAHSDVVTNLPLGAKKIAEDEYSMQGFRWRYVFGIQFHAEFDMETAEAVIENRVIWNRRAEEANNNVTRENFEEAKKTKRLFDNFRNFVEDHER